MKTEKEMSIPDLLESLETQETPGPCPFFGGPATVREWHTGGSKPPVLYWVECFCCGSQGARRDSPAEAIAAWNRRYLNGPLAAYLRALEFIVSHLPIHGTGVFGLGWKDDSDCYEAKQEYHRTRTALDTALQGEERE